ncbi:MAG TPA: co-chaperone GroES [Terracidiphilus sp.]|nr:co-chaperone GroES [Terracidiphilus sp.]
MATDVMEISDRRAMTIKADAEALTGTEPEATEPQPAIQTVAEVDRVYGDPLPIFDRILIKQGAPETTWGESRIVIPDYVQKAPNMGAVVACAKHYIVDGKAFPMDELVKPGDLVTFSKFNAEEIERDGETYVLCSVFDVKLIESVSFALGVSHASGL